MTEFSNAIRDALAAPFEPAQIGKRPTAKSGKDFPRCNLCGTKHEYPNSPYVHIDYVGHAMVTNRLNMVVGPGNWSYVIDEWREANGHLIAVVGTMTVLGRTTGQEIGKPQTAGAWGDEAKTAISDFISRAAMRFGVALDLWSKQELETSPDPGSTPVQGADTNGRPGKAANGDRGAAAPASSAPHPAGEGDTNPAGADGGSAPAANPPAAGAAGEAAPATGSTRGRARSRAAKQQEPSTPAPAPPAANPPAGGASTPASAEIAATMGELCDALGIKVNSAWLKLRRAGNADKLPEQFKALANLEDVKALAGQDFRLAKAFLLDEATKAAA